MLDADTLMYIIHATAPHFGGFILPPCLSAPPSLARIDCIVWHCFVIVSVVPPFYQPIFCCALHVLEAWFLFSCLPFFWIFGIVAQLNNGCTMYHNCFVVGKCRGGGDPSVLDANYPPN